MLPPGVKVTTAPGVPPLTEMLVDEPLQIAVELPIAAVGNGETVIIVDADELPELEVIVTVTVLVIVGVTVTLAPVVADSAPEPDVQDQVYVGETATPGFAVIDTLLPLQIVAVVGETVTMTAVFFPALKLALAAEMLLEVNNWCKDVFAKSR